ncbi:hypothetical protein X943_002364 [Babesia divergens]|uniref:Uncharacterized protein n=1 Tax=Babesia divergens TaxID=32595 RepID=A0AAD9LGV0_BABDI|nr:hypothetical protein X943_002364 [Babesia divergens]
MTFKRCITLASCSIAVGYAFVVYRVNLTRRDALKRFEQSEDGRRLTVESVSFAPKIQTDQSDVSTALLNKYIAEDRMRYRR